MFTPIKKLVFLFLLGSSCAYAQRNFTIDETVYGPGKFAPKNFYGLQWQASSDVISHVDENYQNLVLRQSKDDWAARNTISSAELQQAVREILPSEKITFQMFPMEYTW